MFNILFTTRKENGEISTPYVGTFVGDIQLTLDTLADAATPVVDAYFYDAGSAIEFRHLIKQASSSGDSADNFYIATNNVPDEPGNIIVRNKSTPALLDEIMLSEATFLIPNLRNILG